MHDTFIMNSVEDVRIVHIEGEQPLNGGMRHKGHRECMIKMGIRGALMRVTIRQLDTHSGKRDKLRDKE